jgi:hypothetical protein
MGSPPIEDVEGVPLNIINPIPMEWFPVHILYARTAPLPKPECPFNLQLKEARVLPSLRAEFGVAVDLEASILAA